MSMRNIRFILKEIELYHDGDKFVSAGKIGRKPYNPESRKKKDMLDNIVEAKLEYPRSGAALISTMKLMDLPSRRKVELETDDFWKSGLFKEDVDTETRFTLTVSDRDSVGKLGKWLRTILSLAFKNSLGGKIKDITNLFQGAVATNFHETLTSSIKGKDGDHRITPLCYCKPVHIILSPNGFEAFVMAGSKRKSVRNEIGFDIDLYAARSFSTQERVYDKSSKSYVKKPKVMFAKNKPIGKATVMMIGA